MATAGRRILARHERSGMAAASGGRRTRSSVACCLPARCGLRARPCSHGCAAAAGPAWDGTPSGQPRALNSVDGLSDPAFRAALTCAEFNQVPYLAPLRATVRRILGAGAFSYPVKVLRAVYPERPGPRFCCRYVHYDYAIGGGQDMLTSWLPLMEIPAGWAGWPCSRAVTIGRLSRPTRSAGLNQAGPRPATSPVTCSSSTASRRTRRCRTPVRRCGSPAISAGRRPITRLRPSSSSARQAMGGKGSAGCSMTSHGGNRSRPALTCAPGAELAARQPGPSHFFAVHPGWQAWRPPPSAVH